MRLVRGGWAVPCRIERHHDTGFWRVTIDGAEGEWNSDEVAAGVDRVWHHGQMITEAEFAYLNATRDDSPPDHPARQPHKRVHTNLLAPLAMLPRRTRP